MRLDRSIFARFKPQHLFALALVVRLIVLGVRTYPIDASENLRAGYTLATKGYLGDPFGVPTGPTAHVAPMYPVMVGLVQRATNDAKSTGRVLKLICALAGALNIALLIPLGRAMRLPDGAGAVAGLMWVIPLFTWIELGAEYETIFTVTAVLLLLLLAASRVNRNTLSARDGLATGLATGIAVHLGPLVLPMVACALAPTLLRRRSLDSAVRELTRFGGAFLFAFVVAVLPYGLRNYRTLGAPMLVRDNLGLELSVSNADDARVTADANLRAGGGMARHPANSKVESERVRSMGEVAYNRLRMREALEWMRSHPAAFATLTLAHARNLLMPGSKRAYQAIFAKLIALLSFAGLVLLATRRQWRVVLMLLCAVAGYEAIYLFIQYDVRYVYPMLWVQSLAAASFVVVALRLDRRTGGQSVRAIA